MNQNTFGRILAFEMDGLGGGVAMMDDSNVPSLLSRPYLAERPHLIT